MASDGEDTCRLTSKLKIQFAVIQICMHKMKLMVKICKSDVGFDSAFKAHKRGHEIDWIAFLSCNISAKSTTADYSYKTDSLSFTQIRPSINRYTYRKD